MRPRCQLVTSSKGLLDPPRPPCSKLERWHNSRDRTFPGGVAERLIAPVLKTGRPKGLVSSNLTPSVSLVMSAFGTDCITVQHNKSTEIHPRPPMSSRRECRLIRAGRPDRRVFAVLPSTTLRFG